MSNASLSKAKPKGENEASGFAIAVVFLIIGTVLFFSWDSFGNEVILKMVSTFLIFFGFAGLGSELSSRTNDEGALEMGVGLAFIFSSLIIKSTFIIIPNFIILIGVTIGAIFLATSIFRLLISYTPSNKSSKSINTTKKIYKVLIIIGQILGTIVSFVKFFIWIF